MVLATYDDDGTHEENGRTVYHHKGDYKIDPITGKPFYETVGNREIYDKDVLHATDTLTREGTKINKYDFFDSDGLDKSMYALLGDIIIEVDKDEAVKVGIAYYHPQCYAEKEAIQKIIDVWHERVDPNPMEAIRPLNWYGMRIVKAFQPLR